MSATLPKLMDLCYTGIDQTELSGGIIIKLWYTYYISGYEESDNVETYDVLSPEQEAAYHAAVASGEDPEVALASFLDEIREGIVEQEKENFAEWGEEWDDAYKVVLTDLQWKQ